MLPHAARFELFTRTARARIVATDLFSDVADGLALLVRRLLAGGDRFILLPADAARGRSGLELRLRLGVDGARPIELVVPRTQVIEELGVEMLDAVDQVRHPVAAGGPHLGEDAHAF